MATNQYVNKVEFGGNVLVDLTADTVTPDKVSFGVTFHLASGEPAVGTADGSTRVPEGYAEVEYLQSSGNCYVDTGIKPTDNTRMEMRIYTTCTGSFYAAGARASAILFAQSGSMTNATVLGVVNGTTVTAKNSDNSDFTRVAGGQTYDIMLQTNGDGTFDYTITDEGNSETFSKLNTSYSSIGTVSTTIYVFALRSNNIVTGTNRVYEFRLFQNGAKVCEFVPCYRVSDNEPGFYDLVRDAFYPNDGSGTFTVGDVVVPTNIPSANGVDF